MKKVVVLVLSFALPMILVIGCAPAPVAPTNIPSPVPPTLTSEPAQPMPIMVSPFYSSEGTKISVGNYSQQLGTNDIQELIGLEKEMAQQRHELTPEQMFVLAIRLYDLGEKDTSVYWFYEAQFRAKLFLQTIDRSQYVKVTDPTYNLLLEYDFFTESVGKFINGYAGCDVDNWVKIVGKVREDNPEPPELTKLFPDSDFVEQNQWQGINDEVAAGLGVLIDQLTLNKKAIREQRAANNLDTLYCN